MLIEGRVHARRRQVAQHDVRRVEVGEGAHQAVDEGAHVGEGEEARTRATGKVAEVAANEGEAGVRRGNKEGGEGGNSRNSGKLRRKEGIRGGKGGF